jgi:hypothetical protein
VLWYGDTSHEELCGSRGRSGWQRQPHNRGELRHRDPTRDKDQLRIALESADVSEHAIAPDKGMSLAVDTEEPAISCEDLGPHLGPRARLLAPLFVTTSFLTPPGAGSHRSAAGGGMVVIE